MSIIRIQGDAERAAGVYYEVDTESAPLGVGGMGQVFRGVRVDSRGIRMAVAIKFLFDDLSAGAIERSRREASIQIHNENLVEMFGFIEVAEPGTGKKHYHVVSELLEGVMLFDLLQGKTTDASGKPVQYAVELYNRLQTDAEGAALEIVKSVVSGVMALHDKGYIHRDIDPSNIMVTSSGTIKLIDFGIAKQIRNLNTQDHPLTSAGQFMGKAAYAPPELITGDIKHQNETTDIYAIGILLFRLITGHEPYEGADHEVLEMHMRRPMPLKEVANKEVRNVIDRATRKKQAERYGSAAEFRVAVEKAIRDYTTAGSGSAITMPAVNRRTAIIGGAVAAALIVIAAIFAIVPKGSAAEEKEPVEAVAETKGAIIDSEAEETLTEGGVTRESAGLIIARARKQLTDPATVEEAMKSLKEVVDANLKSSAGAAALLSCIYSWSLPDDELAAVQQKVEKNDKRAFEMASLAYQLNPENYMAVYLIADSYLAGPDYTGGLQQRDPAKALELFKQAKQLAEKAGNQTIVNRCEIRLNQLGS